MTVSLTPPYSSPVLKLNSRNSSAWLSGLEFCEDGHVAIKEYSGWSSPLSKCKVHMNFKSTNDTLKSKKTVGLKVLLLKKSWQFPLKKEVKVAMCISACIHGLSQPHENYT